MVMVKKEYEGSAIITWIGKGSENQFLNPSYAIAKQIVNMKEDYIKSRLRFPFYILPFTRIAAKFTVLEEHKPTIGIGRIDINIKLVGNPRYPKWVSRIFIRGED